MWKIFINLNLNLNLKEITGEIENLELSKKKLLVKESTTNYAKKTPEGSLREFIRKGHSKKT